MNGPRNHGREHYRTNCSVYAQINLTGLPVAKDQPSDTSLMLTEEQNPLTHAVLSQALRDGRENIAQMCHGLGLPTARAVLGERSIQAGALRWARASQSVSRMRAT